MPVRVEAIEELSQLPKLDLPPLDGLTAFVGHEAPLVLAAFESERCVGLLPLKRVEQRPFGFRALKLERAGALWGHGDDAAARAMLEYLVRNERFGLLELCGETASGPFARAARRLESLRHAVRYERGPARAIVPLARDLDTWFHSLDGWAAPLARRTRSLVAAGELELISSRDARAGKDLLAMYLELEARSYKLDAGNGVSSDPRRTARHTALAESGATLFHFLLLDGLPIAGTLSLKTGDREVQLEGVCDMSFEDTAPDEILLMLEVRDAICRGSAALELCPDLVPRANRLGATETDTVVVQIYRRFGPHHLDSLWRRWFAQPKAAPSHSGPLRSDIARQLRARTHATEALDRLDTAGADVERLWGDTLRAALPFEVQPAEHERVRRAV